MSTPIFDFPTGISAKGKGTLHPVPALANTAAPTLAEIQAGFPLGCALTGSFTPSTEQGTSTDERYCSAQTFESPGNETTTIENLEYVYDPQTPDDADGEYHYYSKLKKGTKWFLIDRRGMQHDAPYEAGQFVDVYTVELGRQNRVAIGSGDDAGKFRVSQKPFVVGPTQYDVAIVA